MNHAAWCAYDEFAAGILANAASRCTESSPLRSATLTCARRCAPSSVHRICWCFAIRWLTQHRCRTRTRSPSMYIGWAAMSRSICASSASPTARILRRVLPKEIALSKGRTS
jgi:hypothetical protein